MGVDFHFHVAAARDFASLPFESRNQTKIIEHGRAEKQGDVADGFDSAFGDGFYVRDLCLRDTVVRGDKFGELANFDEERAEGLADFVVEFARNRAALFLLSFHEASGQAFEFEAAAGEGLIALAGLPLEAKDV